MDCDPSRHLLGSSWPTPADRPSAVDTTVTGCELAGRAVAVSDVGLTRVVEALDTVECTAWASCWWREGEVLFEWLTEGDWEEAWPDWTEEEWVWPTDTAPAEPAPGATVTGANTCKGENWTTIVFTARAIAAVDLHSCQADLQNNSSPWKIPQNLHESDVKFWTQSSMFRTIYLSNCNFGTNDCVQTSNLSAKCQNLNTNHN